MRPAQYARIRLENERYPRLLKSGELFFVHRIAGRVIPVPRKSNIALLLGLIETGAGDIVSAIEQIPHARDSQQHKRKRGKEHRK